MMACSSAGLDFLNEDETGAFGHVVESFWDVLDQNDNDKMSEDEFKNTIALLAIAEAVTVMYIYDADESDSLSDGGSWPEDAHLMADEAQTALIELTARFETKQHDENVIFQQLNIVSKSF